MNQNHPILPAGLTIQPSSLHGNGVFTTTDLSANRCLGPFVGTEMPLNEFKAKYGKDVRYCYQLGRCNKIIVAKDPRNWQTYLNESDTPNCYFKQRGCWTSCAIPAGTELTLKYDRKGVIKYPREYEVASINPENKTS
jgi:hypothetical protein